jgi:hypothetical protein
VNHPMQHDVAGELAGLVAREHQRVGDERARRELAEATATELAKLLVRDQAALEQEREARERAEARLRELCGLVDEERPRRFVPAGHGSESRSRQRVVVQHLS